jgi:hypothetical protein
MPTPAEAGATKDTKVAQALACVVFLIFSQLPVTRFFCAEVEQTLSAPRGEH